MRDYAALVVLGSWMAFLPVMLMQLPGLFGHTTRRNPKSRLGIAVVASPELFVLTITEFVPPKLALAPLAGAANVTATPLSGLDKESVTFT